MITSALVYGFMIISMYYLGVVASNRQRDCLKSNINPATIPFFTSEVVAILTIFTFFAAVRWQVGVDHLSYLSEYEYYEKHGTFSRETFEQLFVWIVHVFTSIGLHSAFFFGLFAFITIFFIYYRFKDERYLYSFLGFLIVCMNFTSMMNGMRQWVAVVIFIFATKFIVNKKPIHYLLSIGLAFLFHKSAVILLPLYFIPNRTIFKNRYINIVAIIVSIIIGMTPTWIHSLGSISSVLSVVGYQGYAENYMLYVENEMGNKSFGLQRLVMALFSILVCWFAKELAQRYKHFDVCFSLMMIGVLMYNLFVNTSHLLIRPAMYFMVFSTICMAYLLHHLKTGPKNELKLWVYYGSFVSGLVFLTWICYSASQADMDFTNYKFLFGR